MKKRFCALTAVFLMLLSISVSATEPRASRPKYSLNFNGTTATCDVEIWADSDSDIIGLTVQLWDGDTCLKTWTDTGTGALSFSETHSRGISAGKSYTMTVSYSIAGKIYPKLSTSAICWG
ncbi:hypothetical protein [uncultured Dysosmobacter sp.]|uniref:hypothetical protein n=1 Tax=uncultured Dysosmobacter sp. TaxID=2591384 RepID=UPI0026245328|nr:hypothetical protein [uncultured Dysosmobacter sp.]